MNLFRTTAALIVIGMLYTENGVATETTSPKSAVYLQLAFVQSAADCKAEQQAWSKAHSTTDMATQCFSNASPPSDRRRLPSYLFQVASTKSALQPTAASQAFTYRALGPIQLAKDQEGANPIPPGDGEVKFYQMMVFSNPPAMQSIKNLSHASP